MIGVVVAGHGKFPEGLVSTTKRIMGDLREVAAIAPRPIEKPYDFQVRLEKVIEKVSSQEGVLVLVDIYGGSASSYCLQMQKDFPIRVITGASLPMLLAAIHSRKKMKDLDAVANLVEQVGKKSITNTEVGGTRLKISW